MTHDIFQRPVMDMRVLRDAGRDTQEILEAGIIGLGDNFTAFNSMALLVKAFDVPVAVVLQISDWARFPPGRGSVSDEEVHKLVAPWLIQS